MKERKKCRGYVSLITFWMEKWVHACFPFFLEEKESTLSNKSIVEIESFFIGIIIVIIIISW